MNKNDRARLTALRVRLQQLGQGEHRRAGLYHAHGDSANASIARGAATAFEVAADMIAGLIEKDDGNRIAQSPEEIAGPPATAQTGRIPG